MYSEIHALMSIREGICDFKTFLRKSSSHLIAKAGKFYAEDSFDIELDQMVYVVDSETINLCLAISLWAKFRERTRATDLPILCKPCKNQLQTRICLFPTDRQFHRNSMRSDCHHQRQLRGKALPYLVLQYKEGQNASVFYQQICTAGHNGCRSVLQQRADEYKYNQHKPSGLSQQPIECL